MLIDEKFIQLWMDANRIEDRNEFLKKGMRDSMDSSDICKTMNLLEKIWDMAHLTMKEVVSGEGMSQRAFAETLGAPKRTVEDWCRGLVHPPVYARLWLHIILGHFSPEEWARERTEP